MATPPIRVDDPQVTPAHSGDGHGHGEPEMLVGHDGNLHPSNRRFYFVSAEQQFEASKLGMWLFLATEILLFGGMFVAYGIFRVLYPELYEAASLQLNTALGAFNTLVLLLSSLTMAWAIRAIQMDNRKLMLQLLSATILLAGFFLVVKYFEYTHKFHEGIFPGSSFELNEDIDRVSDLTGATELTPIFVPSHGDDHGDDHGSETDGAEAVGTDAASETANGSAPLAGGPEAEAGEEKLGGDKTAIYSDRRAGIFFSIYYVMTGIHAIHIIIGMIAIGFLVFYGAKGRYSSVWYTPVENVGLYWHIVDIIWIFVFPLMYLI
ncbi:MAG: cytochrome c oxidase subunit 3 [Bacteroidota bacterium]